MDSKLFIAPDKLLLKVRGQTGSDETSSATTPLHIIALIDTSASMEHDERLKNVKRSLHFMLPMLNSADLVSLVTFDDIGQIRLKAQPMTPNGLHYSQQILQQIRTAGSTNLGAGLFCAMECISATPISHKVGMLILTDGEVNEGIKDSNDLIGLIRNCQALNQSLSVFSVGYGLNHNFELLRSIATEGNGSYTVVHNQDHVASVFGDMLGGLMTCVAQNIEVIVPKPLRVHTLLRTSEDDDKYHVHLGDLYADAEQELLIYVANAMEPSQSITIRYFDLRDRTVKVVSPEVIPMTPTEAEAATILELRIQAAKLLGGSATGRDELLATISAIRALTNQPVWADFVLRELEYLANPPAAPSHARQVSAAQQSATLALGRGIFTHDVSSPQAVHPYGEHSPQAVPPYGEHSREISMVEMDPVNITQVFSSPAQRRVTETLRAQSQQP